MNILVLCTGNSARSILLECLLNRLSNGRIQAYSAGSKPAGKVHPQSITILTANGFATEGLRSKSWDEFGANGAPEMDAVITVCGAAAGETCPMWAGAPLRAHWGVEDPAAAAPEQWEAAFQLAFDQLHARAKALCDLDLAGMDKSTLGKELTRIGSL